RRGGCARLRDGPAIVLPSQGGPDPALRPGAARSGGRRSRRVSVSGIPCPRPGRPAGGGGQGRGGAADWEDHPDSTGPAQRRRPASPRQRGREVRGAEAGARGRGEGRGLSGAYSQRGEGDCRRGRRSGGGGGFVGRPWV